MDKRISLVKPRKIIGVFNKKPKAKRAKTDFWVCERVDTRKGGRETAKTDFRLVPKLEMRRYLIGEKQD